jgi:hypothetical protein
MNSRLMTRVRVGVGAVVLVVAPAAFLATPASASGTNPQTGCIGANNMMQAPGMSTQGWKTLPGTNPGKGPSSSGMVNAMMVSDPLWPVMCLP